VPVIIHPDPFEPDGLILAAGPDGKRGLVAECGIMPTLLHELWTDLHDVRVLWQLAVIAAALALAWWASRRAVAEGSPDDTAQFTVGGLQRLQFPLTALIAVLIGRAVLKQWQPVSLLNIAVPLLTALAVIRVIVFALRRVFASGGWVRASERYLVWAVWIGFALYITGLAPHLIRFLDEIGFDVGDNRFTLLMILNGTLAVLATLLVALWLGRAIESRLMRAPRLHMSLRVMLSKLAQALLVVIAVLIALPVVGVDVTVLSIFGGAIGVGLGFGLQKIASNYVSGFIILMDRSVGIGDVVTVDRYSGELVKMTARYVVVRGSDGTETLIPNETLVTTPVVNHSYTDRRVRVAVPLQVDYRSDLQLAQRLMQEAGAGHRRALREPAPDVQIKQFAENGVELELGVWIEDPQVGPAGLRSDLYATIWDSFKAHGVQMPPPKYGSRIA
jgi:small-conductance mechanosensitive channel